MALNLGELSIALELENDRFRAGLAEAKRELETIPPAARREMVKVSRVMDEEGGKSGGLLARGLHSGLVRNSPLIVAGVGAALAAGAPVMTAAAGVLFAGVGAAAAAQSVEVRSAWNELGREIRDGAVADAAVLVPVYVEMADEIGSAFQRIRPQLRAAFADSAPLIGATTDGVIDLAENAMPGLVLAVQRGEPVFQGLEHFLGAVGSGVSDFLDAVSSHGPAAGAVFASLGDIVGDLLPIIGELMGQGAELASDVLPAVAMATGLTLDVLQMLGPLLPSIVAGFVAFKAAKSAAGYLQTFAVQAQYATIAATGSVSAGERVGGAMSKVADNVGKASAALPALGVVIAGIASDMSNAEAKTSSWAQAILDGGAAAAAARDEYANNDYFLRGLDEWTGLAASMDDAEKEADELKAAMTPLQRAQQDVTTATNELNLAINEHGSASPEAAAAADALTAAERELERQNAATELAMHGVTSAMIEQADQALAGIDSNFAYRKALDDLEDAQANLNAAITEQGAGSEAAQRAQLALEEQSYRTALAFGQQKADLSGLSADSLEYKRIVQQEMLGELQRLHDAAGPEMQAAIGQQIAALQASGVTLAGNAALTAALAGQVEGLTGRIHEVPGQKFVQIDAPTEDQKRRLEALGYTVVNLPNGDIYVAAHPEDAEAALNYTARDRTSAITQYVSQVVLGGATPKPEASNGGRPIGLPPVPGRAKGGPVWPGEFWVGEEGPELVRMAGPGHVFTASQSEAITRARQVGGSGAVGVAPAAAAAPRVLDNSTHTTTVYAQVDAARLAREMENQRRDREFLAGVI